jgi:ketosteroid isomerase-like protein
VGRAASRRPRWVVLAVACIGAAFPMHAGAQSARRTSTSSVSRTIVGRVDSLLQAYGRKDLARVMAAVDSEAIVAFGTDSSEVRRGGAAFARQMREDFALWDSTRFGPVRDVTVQSTGGATGALATALFAVPADIYTAGGRRTHVLLRFATTWRRRDSGWRLVQEMSAVATVGQSAADLRR